MSEMCIPHHSLMNQSSSFEQPKAQNVTVNVQQPNLNQLAILSNRKSEGLAYLLIFFFGPFGLLYANPKKAITVIIWMIIAVIVCALLIKDEGQVYYLSALVGIVFWIISIVIGIDGVKEHNRSLLQTATATDVQSASVVAYNISGGKAMEKTKEEVRDENYKREIAKLHNLILAEKKKFFGGMTDEILGLLDNLCETREDAVLLINAYSNLFGSDLIKDLKDLNNSYEAIRRNVSKFIELDLVEEDYPHALKE